MIDIPEREPGDVLLGSGGGSDHTGREGLPQLLHDKKLVFVGTPFFVPVDSCFIAIHRKRISLDNAVHESTAAEHSAIAHEFARLDPKEPPAELTVDLTLINSAYPRAIRVEDIHVLHQDVARTNLPVRLAGLRVVGAHRIDVHDGVVLARHEGVRGARDVEGLDRQVGHLRLC